MPQAGDLLFFTAEKGNLFDQIVARVTGGVYVHCEVVVSETDSIGALGGGVTRHAIPDGVTVAPTSGGCLADRLPGALAWLEKQVHTRYAFIDLADDAERMIFRHGLFFFRLGHYDCSMIAACFLVLAGYSLPPSIVAAPNLCTPMDLARAVGVSAPT